MGDFVPEGVGGSGGSFAQQGLELGEEVLDGVQVGRVRRQKEEFGAGGNDGLFDLGGLVASGCRG